MKCVEEALREIRSQAAMISFMAQCAAESARIPEQDAQIGLSDVCDNIRSLADAIRQALDVDALGQELPRKAR